MATAPEKLETVAKRANVKPHMKTQAEEYFASGSRCSNRFVGYYQAR